MLEGGGEVGLGHDCAVGVVLGGGVPEELLDQGDGDGALDRAETRVLADEGLVVLDSVV